MGKQSVSEIDLVIQLADEFLERYRRGQRPKIDEYTALYPELAEQIRELFPSLIMMEELAPGDSLAEERTAAARGGDLPDRIGDYQIIRKLGQGGMGVVYEAEQQSLRRRVALKLLSSSARGNLKAFERFQLEAQAAARLHHPNIVPVLGFGQEEGVWYYAMQLIHGHGLDQVLVELRRMRGDQEAEPPEALHFQPTEVAAENGSTVEMGRDNSATTPDRWSLPGESEFSDAQSNRGRYFRGVARIGIQVAQALDCAHAEGILHRDIKPSNLLLDMQANVWVTDFGLAKSQNTDLTDTGDIVGTLRYMAPERFRGWSDPRSDVYGLGITLYEMLVFRPAFDSADRVELIRRATHDAPPLPRSIDPAVPRELETVVLKAISKEPGERYQTAGELADDLQRFLDDKPVRARRAGVIEHSIRWYRRNRLVASLSCLLIMALVLGLAGAILLWRRAEGERRRADAAFQKSHEAVDDFVALTLRNEELQAAYRHKVLASALSYYEDFVRRSEGDPALQEKLARTYGQIGSVYLWQGRPREALKAFEQQRELLNGLLEPSPDRLDYRVRLAVTEGNLAETQVALGDGVRGAAHGRQGLETLGAASQAEDATSRRARANLLGTLAKSWQLTGDTQAAVQSHRESLRLHGWLVEHDPANDDFALSYVTESLNAANALFELGQYVEARRLVGQAIPTARDVRQRHAFPELAIQLSQMQGLLSRIQLQTGQYREALQSATQALKTHGEVPSEALNTRRSWIKMNLLDRQASAHMELGNVAEAQAALAAAVQLQGREVHAQGGFLARILTHYAETFRFQGDGKQAVDWLRQSEEICRQFLRNRPRHAATRHQLALALGKRAEGYVGSTRYADRAAAWLAEALEIHEQLVQDHGEVPEYALALAAEYRVRGELAAAKGASTEAIRDFEKATELCRRIRQRHSDLVSAAAELARIDYARGRLLARDEQPAAAIQAYRQAIDNWCVCYPQWAPDASSASGGTASGGTNATPPTTAPVANDPGTHTTGTNDPGANDPGTIDPVGGNVTAAVVCGACYCNLGQQLFRLHDAEAAERATRQAVTILGTASGRDPRNRAASDFLAKARKLLAMIQTSGAQTSGAQTSGAQTSGAQASGAQTSGVTTESN
jgi:serine/threonine protein kinase